MAALLVPHAAAAARPPFRVSTMTCNGTIGVSIDISLFFTHARVVPTTAAKGILWTCMFGGANLQSRGTHPKGNAFVTKRRDNTRSFDNQVTAVMRINPTSTPNTKLFLNGNVHITGVRSPEDGYAVVCALADEVRRIATDVDPAIITGEGSSVRDIEATNFCVRMINSDFSVGYQIRRRELQNVLKNDYGMVVFFTQDNYPGVKLNFYWNSDFSAVDQGVCACPYGCIGNGIGKGEGGCKRVCVSIFQSGKVLITGASAIVQVQAAYDFISRVLNEHRHQLELRNNN